MIPRLLRLLILWFIILIGFKNKEAITTVLESNIMIPVLFLIVFIIIVFNSFCNMLEKITIEGMDNIQQSDINRHKELSSIEEEDIAKTSNKMVAYFGIILIICIIAYNYGH